MALLILALLQAGGASRVSGRTPNETPCAACAFGPVTLRGGAPQPYTFNFPGEVDRIAELWVQVTGQATVEAAFRLNGEFVGEGQGALVPLRRGLSRYPADLQTFNVLEVFLGQDTVGRIRLLVRYRGRTPPLDRPCPPDGPVLSHLPRTWTGSSASSPWEA